jgi:hypothetical protein
MPDTWFSHAVSNFYKKKRIVNTPLGDFGFKGTAKLSENSDWRIDSPGLFLPGTYSKYTVIPFSGPVYYQGITGSSAKVKACKNRPIEARKYG